MNDYILKDEKQWSTTSRFVTVLNFILSGGWIASHKTLYLAPIFVFCFLNNWPCVLVRILRKNRTNKMEIYTYDMSMRFLSKELAHATVEAKESHDLQSASWRPGRAAGVVLVWGPGVMIKEVPVWEQGKITVPAQLSGKKSKFAFLLPLILLRPSTELCDARLH